MLLTSGRCRSIACVRTAIGSIAIVHILFCTGWLSELLHVESVWGHQVQPVQLVCQLAYQVQMSWYDQILIHLPTCLHSLQYSLQDQAPETVLLVHTEVGWVDSAKSSFCPSLVPILTVARPLITDTMFPSFHKPCGKCSSCTITSPTETIECMLRIGLSPCCIQVNFLQLVQVP